MERKLIITEDGSRTLFVPELGEHYHSIHGATTESEHIYIQAAFDYYQEQSVHVLEFGMGTGLNVLLTYLRAERDQRRVFYHTIEKYPVTKAEVEQLNNDSDTHSVDSAIFNKIHDCQWNRKIQLSSTFTLFKEKNDFRKFVSERIYDVIYFDPFAPDIQPELWTTKIFEKIFAISSNGAILTTYSSKGQVKRDLIAAGFIIEKLPGPPGKREFIRAIKPA